MVTSIDKKSALVLIDLQKGIVQYPVAHPIQNVLANAAELVAAFRKVGLPVVIVNVNPVNAAWTKSRKDAPSSVGAMLNEDWFKITPEIKTELNDIFITKHSWNAFYETTLDNELKKHQVTGIVIGGVSTSIGVEGTARAASDRGYNITFATDAMTDMVADAHENSLKYIFPRMGEVDTTQKIIEMVAQINIS